MNRKTKSAMSPKDKDAVRPANERRTAANKARRAAAHAARMARRKAHGESTDFTAKNAARRTPDGKKARRAARAWKHPRR